MMRIYAILLMVFSLFSCAKEEPLLPGRFLTDQIGQADMVSRDGVDYQMQLYFDMSSGLLKASNVRDEWDLGFGCDISQPNLFVNSAMNISVAATGSSDFNATYDPASFNFKFERSGQYFTRGWLSEDLNGGQAAQQVYILNLARDLNNRRRGYVKLQIVRLEADAYVMQIANLDNNNRKELRLVIDESYNNLFLSLNEPDTILKLEPLKEEWDLHFTKYMERLYDGTDTLDYSVTGCMINPTQTSAYYDTFSSVDSTISYASLRLEDVDENLLSSQQNVIGHEWKYFDLDAGTYLVRSNMNFFVRDNESTTYRLRFTGFYNQEGQKGGVTFEYLPL